MTALSSIWRDAWRPPDRRPIWEWAEEHIAAIPYSPNPGAFRIGNSPQIREVFDAIINPRVRLISIIAAVQSSKTTISEIALAYIVANLPGPTLWLNETDEDAKDQSEARLQKLFDSCEPVRSLYPANRHKRRNTTIHFSNGMTLWIAGAHNRTNLQRRSIRWLIGDETWQWPIGHMAEAEARVTAFGWLGKCIFLSQGGVEDDDTHRKFETTDQREWTFACPGCGHRQPFRWENIEWSKDCKDENEQYDFRRIHESTALRCEACNAYLLKAKPRFFIPKAQRKAEVLRDSFAKPLGQFSNLLSQRIGYAFQFRVVPFPADRIAEFRHIPVHCAQKALVQFFDLFQFCLLLLSRSDPRSFSPQIAQQKTPTPGFFRPRPRNPKRSPVFTECRQAFTSVHRKFLTGLKICPESGSRRRSYSQFDIKSVHRFAIAESVNLNTIGR